MKHYNAFSDEIQVFFTKNIDEMECNKKGKSEENAGSINKYQDFIIGRWIINDITGKDCTMTTNMLG